MPIIVPAAGNEISAGTFGVPVANALNAIEPTIWTAMPLNNNWVNAPTYVTQYRKIGDMVHVRGRLYNGTMLVTAFTLPVGFRPPTALEFAVASADAGGNWIFGLLQLQTDGQCYPRAGTNVAMTTNFSFSTLPV